MLLQAKLIGAGLIGALATVMLVWALQCHWRRRPLPLSFYRFSLVVHGVIGIQVFLGIVLLIIGYRAPIMHVLYGAIVLGGAALINLFRAETPIGERYRRQPLAHAFLALFILAVTLRAWMAA